MVPKVDGGCDSMEECGKVSSSRTKNGFSKHRQAKVEEMLLFEGCDFLHSSVFLRSDLILQWGVSHRCAPEKELQLSIVESLCTTVASGYQHDEFSGNEESFQGQVADRWYIDEEVCGGGGSNDAAEEKEPDGIYEEEERHEEEEAWA